MKFTEGGFKRWGYEVAETEFKDQGFTMNEYDAQRKELGEEVCQGCRSQSHQRWKSGGEGLHCRCFPAKHPAHSGRIFGHLATLNLNGDYVSDQLAPPGGRVSDPRGADRSSQVADMPSLKRLTARHRTLPERMWRTAFLVAFFVTTLEYMGWRKASTDCECFGESFLQRGRLLMIWRVSLRMATRWARMNLDRKSFLCCNTRNIFLLERF